VGLRLLDPAGRFLCRLRQDPSDLRCACVARITHPSFNQACSTGAYEIPMIAPSGD
jgi:hypothetical protein